MMRLVSLIALATLQNSVCAGDAFAFRALSFYSFRLSYLHDTTLLALCDVVRFAYHSY